MYNFVMFGAGRIGQVHSTNLAAHPECNLKYVVDVNESAAQALADKYGATVTTVEKALADDDINAVMICSSTNTHADLIERSALAGKYIFCEKPVDLSVERVRSCLKIVEENKAKLMVGFNRRYDPNFAHLKASLDEGVIGDVEMVTVSSRDPGAPPIEYIKVSGGLFRDMTIHDFDIARWMLGEEPVSVYASASSIVDPEIGKAGDVDTAIVTLTCKSGRMAVITNSRRASYGYDQRVEVHGSKGMLHINNILESSLVASTAEGVTAQKPMFFFLERYMPAYRNELNTFVEMMSGKDVSYPGGLAGEKALVLADAAVESLKTGKAVAV